MERLLKRMARALLRATQKQFMRPMTVGTSWVLSSAPPTQTVTFFRRRGPRKFTLLTMWLRGLAAETLEPMRHLSKCRITRRTLRCIAWCDSVRSKDRGFAKDRIADWIFPPGQIQSAE